MISIRNAQINLCLIVSTILIAPLSQASEFGCMLKPIKTVDIRSPVVGRLSSVKVERGSYVKKGQVIAQLDASVEQAAVNSAKFRSQTQSQIIAAQNKVNAARQKTERMQILFDAKFMSAQALDDANNELKIAQAELNSGVESQTLAKYDYKTSLSELDRRSLTSPLNGIVTARYLDVGSIVSPTDGDHPILTIAQTDRLKVQIIAPVKYFNKFKKGSAITIVPEAPFNRAINAKVEIKDSSVDAASGTFSMITYIQNSGNKIPSGILCSIKY